MTRQESVAEGGGALLGATAGLPLGSRRTPATPDPVKALMHRHRALCERAVDPLEIAAGLEAHGVTDRAAAQYRHRDVFALAEEMYARVPRGDDDSDDGPHPGTAGRAHVVPAVSARWALFVLLPGVVCAAVVAGLGAVSGGARLVVVLGGVVAVAVALWIALGKGPLRAATRPSSGGDRAHAVPEVSARWPLFVLLPGAVCAAVVAGLGVVSGGARFVVVLGGVFAVAVALWIALREGPLRVARRPAPATRAWVCWLLAYALLGDALLTSALAGGPDEADELWRPATAALLALAFAVAPAAWCAHLFAVRAGGRLRTSRGLDEFAASARPLLLGVVTLFLAALGALLAAAHALLGAAPGGTSALTGAWALGALLLLARLLGVYGSTRAPALLLAAAGACEVTALCLVFAGRLPGCEAAAVPVTAAVDAFGPGAVPTAVCGAAALVLLIHAARTLALASAHAGPGDAP